MRSSRLGATGVILLVLLLTACAPEPTDPASTDLGGVWTAASRLSSLSNIKLTLVQEPKGIVSGGWSARGDGGEAGCNPKVPCDASGTLIGQNLVSQIVLEFFGAGSFNGTLVEPTKIKGVLVVGSVGDTITFSRTAK